MKEGSVVAEMEANETSMEMTESGAVVDWKLAVMSKKSNGQ